MGYLDYINKKHNRERRIQIIRNKVSGFVLLTIVFMLILGLTLVMTIFLARAFGKMLNKTDDSNGALAKSIVNTTTSPLSGYVIVSSILKSEYMVTKPAKISRNNTLEQLTDEQLAEYIKPFLRQTFKELAKTKRINIGRAGLERFCGQFGRVFNATIIDLTRAPVTTVTSQEPSKDEKEELSDHHYLDFIDELN